MKQMITALVDLDGVRLSVVTEHGVDTVVNADPLTTSLAVMLWGRLTRQELPERADPQTLVTAIRELSGTFQTSYQAADRTHRQLLELTTMVQRLARQMARVERVLDSAERPVTRQDIQAWVCDALRSSEVFPSGAPQ